MSEGTIKMSFDILQDDMISAGTASSSMKKMLNQLGVNPLIVKKAAISMYEAEINAVIHGGGGSAHIAIDKEKIQIVIKDEGPGIPDLNLAMQAGYSTASDKIKAMGFGAGMGLPNIKRYSDELIIDSTVGRGTSVTIVVNLAS